MTTAGLCGLLIAGMELNVRREMLNLDGTATNCGEYDENQPRRQGPAAGSASTSTRRSRAEHVLPPLRPRTGRPAVRPALLRRPRLVSRRLRVPRRAPRTGRRLLARIAGAWDNWPVVSTSFALLFLSKGRTPVLISKLVHGPWPRVEADTDWNNDRNDLRHLVEFASKELFKSCRSPGRRSTDARRPDAGRGDRRHRGRLLRR